MSLFWFPSAYFLSSCLDTFRFSFFRSIHHPLTPCFWWHALLFFVNTAWGAVILCDAACSAARIIFDSRDICAACQRNPSCLLCSAYSQAGTVGRWQSNCQSEHSCTAKAYTNAVSTPQGVPQCESPCGVRRTCRDCAQATGCEWDTVYSVCAAATTSSTGRVRDPEKCSRAQCHLISGCRQCGSAIGCVWCESSQLCINRAAVVTEFGFGQCLSYSGDACANSCTGVTNCDDCLANVRCGWCAVDGNLEGQGTCEAGTIEHSGLYSRDLLSRCNGGSGQTTPAAATSGISTTPAPITTAGSSSDSTTAAAALTSISSTASAPLSTTVMAVTEANSSWQFFQCPDIDECRMDTHQCGNNATCVNLDNRYGENYRCVCQANFRLLADGRTCEPRCDLYGCVHGTCTSPDVCECNLGFTGTNCSIDCGCNGHSTCRQAGPGICDACQSNTEGLSCDVCMDGFHGNASNKGQCIPCRQACNGHSGICQRWPSDPAPICSNCQNNTFGSYCEFCLPGFFVDPAIWKAASALRMSARAYLTAHPHVPVACVPCACNGHSSTCDAETGEGCQCVNSTMTSVSRCQMLQAEAGSCYSIQCSTCLDTVMINSLEVSLDGNPANSSLCYVLGSSGTDFSDGLLPGQTQQFSVTPRFTNVDIRFFIEADESPLRVQAYLTTDRNVSRDVAGRLVFARPPLWTGLVRKE